MIGDERQQSLRHLVTEWRIGLAGLTLREGYYAGMSSEPSWPRVMRGRVSDAHDRARRLAHDGIEVRPHPANRTLSVTAACNYQIGFSL